MNRFEINTEGMRQLHADRRPHELVKELIQNVFDEDRATKCEITVVPALDETRIVVEDDGGGFEHIEDAYTLMGETAKRGDPTKRGRFNMGDKEILSVALEGSIETTGHTVRFPRNGGRTLQRNNRRQGTKVTVTMPWTREDAEELYDRLARFRPPDHITITVNGVELPRPVTTHQVETVLPTVVQAAPGQPLRNTNRRTKVNVCPSSRATGCIYEMGIPIQEIDSPFDVDVQQKVPLPPNRDTVSSRYMQRVHKLVLEAVYREMDKEDYSESWVQKAIEEPDIDPDAVKHTLEGRYGDRVVTWSSNTDSNMKAVDHGYQVMHPRSFSQQELKNLREKGGLKSAHDLFGEDKSEHVYLEEKDLSADMISFRQWVRMLASLTGKHVDVRFVQEPSHRYAASCSMNTDEPTMHINLGRLPEDFVRGRGEEQLELIIHELAHSEMDGEMSHGPKWGDACALVGARIAMGLRQE